MGWLAFPAVAMVLASARRASVGGAAAIGAVFGAVGFGLILAWIIAFGWLAWSALVLLSALFPALAMVFVSIVWRDEHPFRSSFAAAAAWTAVEGLRGAWPLGGLTWGMLGSTQVDLPLAHLAPHVSAWGVSFAVAFVACLLGVAVERGRGGLARAIPAFVTATLVGVSPVLLPFASASGQAVEVATLQVDVRSSRPLGRSGEDLAIAAAHARLHRELAADPPDLAVWGEGALDPAATSDPATMTMIADAVAAIGVPTLVGAVDRDAAGDEQTSVLLFDGAGTQVDRYAKVHLVPFGEYVPWRSRLGFIRELEQIPVDRVPGERASALRVEGLPPFGAPICFENAFADVERDMVRDGAEFLVLTINNASYGMSAASRQHLVMSRLRAIETGRWVVHAAISGITAIIDPTGAIVARRELFVPGITRGTIRASSTITTAVRIGDSVPWASAAVMVIAILLPPSRRRRPAQRAADEGASRDPDPLPADTRALVILPTYNESQTIGEVLERLLALSEQLDVLVVDDGSPDGTADIVRAHAATEPRLRLRERPGKAGLSSAYLLGFREALEGGYGMVVEMDSDLSHLPEELPSLLAATREGLDLTIGSRYIPGGGVTNWSRTRLALSKAGNAYVRLCLGMPVQDATSGFRVYRRNLLLDLTRRPVRSDGYAFQIELAHRAWTLGGRVGERPITFAERAAGASKMSRRIVAEALILVTLWGLRLRLRPSRSSHT